MAIKEYLPSSWRRRYRNARSALLSVGLRVGEVVSQPACEREASDSVSIVVPVRDALEVTRRCLASVERFGPLCEVIVVDDASGPGTRSLIDEFASRNKWIVVRHVASVGHSRACESGAERARRPCLCLLNSDTIVTPWSWAAIKDAFEADGK